MAEHQGQRGAVDPGLSRRDFLAMLAATGPMLAARGRAEGAFGDRPMGAVIQIVMTGGASQLETFDPKPDAPSAIRGPFDSIATSIPGVRICEHLPNVAKRLDRMTVVRGLTLPSASPIHEVGLQMIHTGRLSLLDDPIAPHFGSAASALLGGRGGMPAFVMTGGAFEVAWSRLSTGQGAGFLGDRHAPETGSSAELSARLGLPSRLSGDEADYGDHEFGRSCLLARRLVEQGSRVVTVNMASSVHDEMSWDAHGSKPFSNFDALRRGTLPAFDQGFSALIDDLDARGLLATTLVIAVGEFGRGPVINPRGGRDHWPRAWSGLLAGGPAEAGAVWGATDSSAGEVVDRPTSPTKLVELAYRTLGIDPEMSIAAPDGRAFRLLDATNRRA
ncbi:MAG: DUF1501 domain-containing protein [Isosphaeraceae bacterium]|nr:DUF1501 domain-containing protein [Isosphaeraceae bacterium]